MYLAMAPLIDPSHKNVIDLWRVPNYMYLLYIYFPFGYCSSLAISTLIILFLENFNSLKQFVKKNIKSFRIVWAGSFFLT
jgi:hypothetical protein